MLYVLYVGHAYRGPWACCDGTAPGCCRSDSPTQRQHDINNLVLGRNRGADRAGEDAANLPLPTGFPVGSPDDLPPGVASGGSRVGEALCVRPSRRCSGDLLTIGIPDCMAELRVIAQWRGGPVQADYHAGAMLRGRVPIGAVCRSTTQRGPCALRRHPDAMCMSTGSE